MSAAIDYDSHPLPPQRTSAPRSSDHLRDPRWCRFRRLVVPGWNNSGPSHWQSRWQDLAPDLVRVEQEDWVRPDPGSWIANLDAAISASPQPVVVIAHSLGCIALAHWVRETGGRGVAAALLVAPADVSRPGGNPALLGFAPVPLDYLPFASRVVASDDDPCCSVARATEFAARWGSDLVVIPQGGHLNAASRLDDWPLGQLLLHDLVWRQRRQPA